MTENNISASLEDYLEAIFVLEKRKDFVRVTDIAELLGISKPSVNKAIGTLRESGYIEHETYKNVQLTLSGREKAEQILRRHELIRKFLTDSLLVSAETAEKDACRMEHVMSAETIEKLRGYLESEQRGSEIGES